MNRLLKISVILSFVLISCGEEAVFDGNVVKEYETFIPLSEENEWVYAYKEYDELGNIVEEFPHNVIKVVDEVERNGRTWYKVENGWDFFSNVYYSETSEGHWLFIEEKYDEMEFLIYPTNTRLNTNTLLPAQFEGLEGEHINRVLTNSSIEVITLAGAFDCIEYTDYKTSANEVIISRYYLSKGVGIVKAERYRQSDTNYFVYRDINLATFNIE
ncbi:MAG: hypothetical protein Kapaf2KO_07500 [Candidatus Kapaibacteriales bacterium]